MVAGEVVTGAVVAEEELSLVLGETVLVASLPLAAVVAAVVAMVVGAGVAAEASHPLVVAAYCSGVAAASPVVAQSVPAT